MSSSASLESLRDGMAKIIPSFVDPSTPASERRVLEAIRSSSSATDWTVLHSLGLSSKWAGEFGEIDFVVIMPGLGMVCIEVKGGGVSQRDGVWTTRDRFGQVETLKRSPYRQAQDCQWKLLQALKNRFGAGALEAKCPIGWLVVFPDVECPPLTSEAARDEIIDRHDLDDDIGARIENAPSLVRLRDRGNLAAPNQATCNRLLAFFRPTFERVPAPASDDWDVERQIRILTEEQFAALDAVADNRICLIKGPAGTGKTLIGLECARRHAAGGHRVLVTCFNQRLGAWLQGGTKEFGPGAVVAGHLHGVLRERILSSAFAVELEEAERSGALPEEIFGRLYYELGTLAIEEAGERFDLVVVDEVQDMPAEGLADLIGTWTAGREDARVLLLGDFARQALYGAAETSPARLTKALGPVTSFNLSVNCRNTRRIALEMAVLSGFDTQRISDRQPEGDQVSLQFYSTDEEARAQLDRLVKGLRASGCQPADVILLGRWRLEKSLLADVASVGGWRLKDLSLAGSSDLAYSTIHAFKGLERPVAIVLDAAGSSSDETDALLYVGLSRARLRLFILAEEAVRPRFERRMREGVERRLRQTVPASQEHRDAR